MSLANSNVSHASLPQADRMVKNNQITAVELEASRNCPTWAVRRLHVDTIHLNASLFGRQILRGHASMTLR